MEVASIQQVAAGDEVRAISTLVMAFSEDPTARWLYPEPHAYLEYYPRFARAFGGAAFGSQTAYATGDFGAAALWLPVGVAVDPQPFVELLAESLGAQWLEETGGLLEQMERYHTKEPHWYLAMIGVDPAHQGRGMGSALLRHTLARVDEDGVAAYLESSNPKNVPLYRRHGFEVIGEIQAGDSPPIHAMLRPAR